MMKCKYRVGNNELNLNIRTSADSLIGQDVGSNLCGSLKHQQNHIMFLSDDHKSLEEIYMQL